MNNQLTIGPFFVRDPNSEHRPGEQTAPLYVSVEWATSERAFKIPLFRVLWSEPTSLGLHHLVFRESDLPCDMQCQVEGSVKNFLPLDSLLFALYQKWQICRPIFGVLDELASTLPLYHNVTRPIHQRGLLSPAAEAQGFRANSIFNDAGQSFIQVAWESSSAKSRFHTCTMGFTTDASDAAKSGRWIPSTEVGVSQLLENEFKKHASTDPTQVLTAAGHALLNS